MTVLRKGDNEKDMKALLKKLLEEKISKGVNAKKYCGVIQLKEDALVSQKRMKNDWD